MKYHRREPAKLNGSLEDERGSQTRGFWVGARGFIESKGQFVARSPCLFQRLGGVSRDLGVGDGGCQARRDVWS